MATPVKGKDLQHHTVSPYLVNGAPRKIRPSDALVYEVISEVQFGHRVAFSEIDEKQNGQS